MATQLFKLAIEAESITESNPDVHRYFYLLEEELISSTITIDSTKFFDDAGNQVASNLETAAPNNGYYSLFINGVLQQTSLFTLAGDGSQLVISQGSTIPVSAPITFVVTNFAPDSTINILT